MKNSAATATGVPTRAPIAPIAVSVNEAIRMIGVGRSTFYKMVKTGQIKIVKIGKRTVIPVAGLHTLISIG